MVYNLFFTPFRYLHVLYSHDGKPRGTVVFGIISFVTHTQKKSHLSRKDPSAINTGHGQVLLKVISVLQQTG